MTTSNRICSLDMLRGILVAAIFFFDVPPADMYPILMHKAWQGFSVAEVGLPLFAFMMGTSMAISFSRRTPSMKSLVKRAAIIFALGLFLGTLIPLCSLILVKTFTVENFINDAIYHGRFFGVLQRLSITYLFAVMIVRSIKSDAGIFAATFALLIVSSIGFHIYAPDNPFSPEHNISRAVDYIIPGANHIYMETHDPEGLYGSIAGTSSVLFGYLAGKILIDNAPLNDRIFLMSVAGILFLIVAGLWSFTDIVSKRIWTSPYALINAGLDYLSLALCMKVFDTSPPVKKISLLLIALGKNPLFFFCANLSAAIFLYILPVGDTNAYFWIFEHTTKNLISPEFGTTLFCTMWMLCWFPLAEIFRRFNIVIKI